MPISISLRSEARELQKFAIHGNNAPKCEKRFTSELKVAKVNNYIEKCFKWKLSRIKFHTNKSVDAYHYLLRSGARCFKDQPSLKKCMLWNEKIGSLGLNAAKITDYIKKCFKRKLSRIKFHTRQSVNAYPYLHQEWRQGAPKIFFPEEQLLNQTFNFNKPLPRFFGHHWVKEQPTKYSKSKNIIH